MIFSIPVLNRERRMCRPNYWAVALSVGAAGA